MLLALGPARDAFGFFERARQIACDKSPHLLDANVFVFVGAKQVRGVTLPKT